MSNRKILIIEDEENIARLLKVNLVAAGFTVDNAFDGEEGLIKIDSFKPEVVIADLRMPKVNGWEVCRKLKTEEKYKNILIVILTAFDQKETREKAVLMGADAFFSKPVDIELFIKEIKKIIGRQKVN